MKGKRVSMRGDGGGFEGEGTKGNPSLMLPSLLPVAELCASCVHLHA